MQAAIVIIVLWLIGYAVGSAISNKRDDEINSKLEALENEGMIDLMHHQWERYKSVHPLQINMTALWQKWIRL